MNNPFEAIEKTLSIMCNLMQATHVGLMEMRKELAKPRPEWELMATAVRTRRKARETIVAAVDAGEIRAERYSSYGGTKAYRLWVQDLDRVFPVVT